MQQRVTSLSTRFLIELRRYYYVTPTSYLELINTFKSLIGRKKTEILTAKSRYENGLEKIVSTENMVDGSIIGDSVVRRVEDAAVALRAHGR